MIRAHGQIPNRMASLRTGVKWDEERRMEKIRHQCIWKKRVFFIEGWQNKWKNLNWSECVLRNHIGNTHRPNTDRCALLHSSLEYTQRTQTQTHTHLYYRNTYSIRATQLSSYDHKEKWYFSLRTTKKNIKDERRAYNQRQCRFIRRMHSVLHIKRQMKSWRDG